MLENSRKAILNPANGANAKLFDAKAALERLDGDRELFEMLVEVFHQDSVALYQQLSAGIASGDLALAQRAAHSLKGLCANFDARHATDAAFKVEDLTRRRDSNGLHQEVESLGGHLEELRGALAEWRA